MTPAIPPSPIATDRSAAADQAIPVDTEAIRRAAKAVLVETHFEGKPPTTPNELRWIDSKIDRMALVITRALVGLDKG